MICSFLIKVYKLGNINTFKKCFGIHNLKRNSRGLLIQNYLLENRDSFSVILIHDNDQKIIEMDSVTQWGKIKLTLKSFNYVLNCCWFDFHVCFLFFKLKKPKQFYWCFHSIPI